MESKSKESAAAGRTSEPHLVQLHPDGRVEVDHVLGSDVLEIGRKGDGLVFPQDVHLADRHARIEATGQVYDIVDTGSGSGVWLRVTDPDGVVLAEQDQVWVGAQVLVVGRIGAQAEIGHYGPDGKHRSTFVVDERGTFVGRSADETLDATDSLLSRRHAQFRFDEGVLRLFDRGAHNGTYLKVRKRAHLDDGCEFKIGGRRFRFEWVSAAVPTEEIIPERQPEPEPDPDPERSVTAVLKGFRPAKAAPSVRGRDLGAADTRSPVAEPVRRQADVTVVAPVEEEADALETAEPAETVIAPIEEEENEMHAAFEPSETVIAPLEDDVVEEAAPAGFSSAQAEATVIAPLEDDVAEEAAPAELSSAQAEATVIAPLGDDAAGEDDARTPGASAQAEATVIAPLFHEEEDDDTAILGAEPNETVIAPLEDDPEVDEPHVARRVAEAEQTVIAPLDDDEPQEPEPEPEQRAERASQPEETVIAPLRDEDEEEEDEDTVALFDAPTEETVIAPLEDDVEDEPAPPMRADAEATVVAPLEPEPAEQPPIAPAAPTVISERPVQQDDRTVIASPARVEDGRTVIAPAPHREAPVEDDRTVVAMPPETRAAPDDDRTMVAPRPEPAAPPPAEERTVISAAPSTEPSRAPVADDDATMIFTPGAEPAGGARSAEVSPQPEAPARPGPGAGVEGQASCVITLESGGEPRRFAARVGQTVLEAFVAGGGARNEPIDWECKDGGCGVCVIAISEGAENLEPPPAGSKEMKTIQSTEGVAPDPRRYRLACLARVRGNVTVRSL